MKNNIASLPAFVGCRGLAARRLFSVTIPVVLCAFGIFPAASALAQPISQKEAGTRWQPRPGEHGARARDDESIYTEPSGEEVEPGSVAPPTVVMAPTRSSFLASWQGVPGAIGYRLDLSTSNSFESYVSGYYDLDVGNVTSRIVSGLRPGITYYYRIRAYNSAGISSHEETESAATQSSTFGLVINPTFDSSILNDPKSAAIQSTVNQAIAIYQSLFSDPITISILFRYSNLLPDGSPVGAFISRSDFVVYSIPWNTYLTSLKADAKSESDATANASLPPGFLSTYIVPSSADGRAIGLDTPPAMFANGSVADGGPYDGIVTLNSNQPFRFARPPTSSSYDALRSTEHEIDEILGLGSHLHPAPPMNDLRPQDLFSWSSAATRNTTATGIRYFSINRGSTDIVGFNQDSDYDYGDWLSDSCPQAAPFVQNAFGCKGQISDVTDSSPEGINLDVIGYDLEPPAPTVTIFGNISTRLSVGTGDNVLIGGFIVTGTQPKKIIVRALGPSVPVTGTLPDPFLELHDSRGALIASNDNWRSDQEAEINATGIAPSKDNESAIVTTLDPDSYTAIVKGAHGGTGVGLVEVYDLDPTADSKLANISTRGLVQTGDNVLIGGLIILGPDSTTALIRAIGPSLPVTGPLADPMLELHDKDGTVIASNDDWRTDQEADIIATGIPPTSDAESAILATLTPDSYTAIVSGTNNTTGVALVEAYQLDN